MSNTPISQLSGHTNSIAQVGNTESTELLKLDTSFHRKSDCSRLVCLRMDASNFFVLPNKVTN